MIPTRYGRKKKLMAEINVVPYIDVMLVLLIIFMVTAAPLLSTGGVKVDLPQVKPFDGPGPGPGPEPFVVTVDADGNYYINDNETKISVHEIEAKVKAVWLANPTLPFDIKGDEAVKYGHVAHVAALLKSVGVDSVGLIIDPRADQ